MWRDKLIYEWYIIYIYIKIDIWYIYIYICVDRQIDMWWYVIIYMYTHGTSMASENVGHDLQHASSVPPQCRIWRTSQWMARTWTALGQQGGRDGPRDGPEPWSSSVSRKGSGEVLIFYCFLRGICWRAKSRSTEVSGQSNNPDCVWKPQGFGNQSAWTRGMRYLRYHVLLDWLDGSLLPGDPTQNAEAFLIWLAGRQLWMNPWFGVFDAWIEWLLLQWWEIE